MHTWCAQTTTINEICSHRSQLQQMMVCTF